MRIHKGLLFILLAALAGCQRAPSYQFAGAYFPVWLVFALGAVVVTLLIRAVLIRLGVDEWLRFRIVVYSAIAASLCLSALLIFFAR